MDAQPEVVRQSDLLNQTVLDRETMEELGRVEVLWMYPQAHRVLGFICKSGFLGNKKSAFNLDQVDVIGANGILTHASPEPTDANRVNRLESLLQHEVWSDGGNRIGKIIDYLFDVQTGAVTHYLVVSNGWQRVVGEIYELSPRQILSFGSKRVLIPEGIITDLSVYQEGIQQKLTEMGEFLRQEALQEWQTLAKRAETVTEETKERLQELSEQTKGQTQQLSQNVKEQATTLREQFQPNQQSWVERLRDRGQIAAQRFRKQTHQLSRQVEEGIETIVVQAEEILDTAIEKPYKAKATSSPNSTVKSSHQSEQDAPLDENLDDDEPWI